MLKSPLTLWRYLSLDLWRLVFLSTGVVVAVGCFAMAVKPLADGRLGPVEVLKFMLLATIPMLQYALPFAGGFAATLVYHRFAQDNEAVAAHAGGLSHRVLLVPALLCSLVLAVVMAILIDQAMPRLIRNMDKLIAGDLPRMLESAVGKGESVRMPDSRRYIYADSFVPLEPGDSGADQHFVLAGLVFVEMDDAGKVVWETSASLAYVWLFRDDTNTDPISGEDAGGTMTVKMKLRDAVTSRLHRADVDESTLIYTIPSRFSENPRYLTWVEMEEAYARPERMTAVDRLRRSLAATLGERMTIDGLRAAMNSEGRLQLVDGAGRTVIVRAAGISPTPDHRGFELLPMTDAAAGTAAGEVEVTTVLEDGRTRLHRARHAYLARNSSPDATVTHLNLRMEDVSIRGPGAREIDPDAPRQPGDNNDNITQTGTRASYTLQELSPAADPLPALLAMSLTDLQGAAAKRLAAETAAGMKDEGLTDEASSLTKKVREKRMEIVSKQHERVASVLACIVSLLTGAIMAMRLRESMPLPVYLWSFAPSVAAMMIINGAQRVAEKTGTPGIVLMYSGVVALAIFTFMQFRVLARR